MYANLQEVVVCLDVVICILLPAVALEAVSLSSVDAASTWSLSALSLSSLCGFAPTLVFAMDVCPCFVWTNIALANDSVAEFIICCSSLSSGTSMLPCVRFQMSSSICCHSFVSSRFSRVSARSK